MAELPQQTNAVGEQQGTAQQTSTPQQTTTASPDSTSSPATQQSQEQMGDKKPKKWVWIVVGVLVIVAIIAGAYFLFF